MRAIDADALIEKCGDWYVEEGTESGFIGTLKNLLATMPTIQPEKTQLSQQGTTLDLISRQAAIDALQKCRKHCIDPFDSYHIDIQDAENELMKLPSSQLSVPIGLDLIDRKSAIAEVCKRECNESEPCKGECGAVIALEILPTIQAKPRSGHWIKDNTDDCPPVFKMFRICSECGCVRTEETKYCPNCGVYMEVNKNGTNR